MEFANKVVIITGGGTGIGRETARAFLQRGANVVLNGRRELKLQEALTELDPTGKHVAYLAGDIGKPETARQLIRTTVQRFGGVDILVNNAGIFKPTPFLDYTEEDFNANVNIILGGAFHASQAAIPEMQKRGGGTIDRDPRLESGGLDQPGGAGCLGHRHRDGFTVWASGLSACRGFPRH